MTNHIKFEFFWITLITKNPELNRKTRKKIKKSKGLSPERLKDVMIHVDIHFNNK